jgi:hypothetical protein
MPPRPAEAGPGNARAFQVGCYEPPFEPKHWVGRASRARGRGRGLRRRVAGVRPPREASGQPQVDSEALSASAAGRRLPAPRVSAEAVAAAAGLTPPVPRVSSAGAETEAAAGLGLPAPRASLATLAVSAAAADGQRPPAPGASAAEPAEAALEGLGMGVWHEDQR